MRVEVSRSGGFAGLRRTWVVQVEETPDPQAFLLLIEACPWDEPEPESSGADRFVYQVQAGERSATLPEPAVQGPWLELVDQVRHFSAGHGLGPVTTDAAPADAAPGEHAVNDAERPPGAE